MIGCVVYPDQGKGQDEGDVEGKVLVGWMAGPGRIVWDQAVSRGSCSSPGARFDRG
jgi:hypothetical protein